ncbi:uncharacterized protein LOC141719132 [Apium graveolens]|uniref:uncharacterized protein LOC141719132 n=1 Tax=Apium graveolens TaxID=4045 RepID=UPI003D794CBE
MTCFKCKQKVHYSNECPTSKVDVTCFRCRRKGHVARDYRGPAMAASVPKILALPPPPQQGQPKARTFNMIIKEAVHSPSVIAGTLSVNAVNAKVLIDFGAKRSFNSEEFIDKIYCEMQRLGETIILKLANDDQVPVDRVCPECDIEIARHHFSIDLIPFKLAEFDVILRIDWLVGNNAQIDCANNKVKLRTADNATVIFRSEKQQKKFLTMMQT